MDTRPVAEGFRYRLGNRPQIAATVFEKGHIQVVFYLTGYPRFLDKDIYVLSFRDLERSRIVDLKAITVFAFHNSHPLFLYKYYAISALEKPSQPFT
jgi:hypothetical protein